MSWGGNLYWNIRFCYTGRQGIFRMKIQEGNTVKHHSRGFWHFSGRRQSADFAPNIPKLNDMEVMMARTESFLAGLHRLLAQPEKPVTSCAVRGGGTG